MKKTISVVALASVLAAGTAFASGYRIPEQSADSTAKAGANIAGALGPDAAYYNPANMSWMGNDTWVVEGDLTYIYLSSVEYEDNRSSLYNSESEDENFLLPTFFLVSPDYNGLHFGFSFTVPYGLSKRWEDNYASAFAHKFALKVFDFNPTMSYKINEMFSFAGGVRMLYSQATVISSGVVSAPATTASRYIDGDTVDWGWNAAFSIRPTEASNISITYRSKVDLEFEGDAELNTNFTLLGESSVSTTGEIVIPAPAVLALSGAYDFGKAKVEFTIDRTFWSELEEFDFNYDVPITNPVLYSAFDKPKEKNWKDTNAYRLGLDYVLNSTVTLMAGFAYDENPVPDENIGFELPDSDAYLFSVGARFKVSEKSQIACGFLYDYKESRDAKTSTIDGEFTNASAFLASLGYTYSF